MIRPLIAFVESNTTGTGEEFLKSSINQRFEVIFLSSNPQKYNFIKNLLIHPTIINTDNFQEVYAYLKDIKGLKAIISTSERYIDIASEVAEALSLPAANPKAIKNCRNKFKLLQALEASKLPTIKTSLVYSFEEAKKDIKQFKFPVVVKPNFGTGSIGVKLCKTEKEVLEQINELPKHSDGILIQDYVLGEEFSAEIIAFTKDSSVTYHLLGITKKYLGSEPYFVEVGHEFPASLKSELQKKVYETICKILEDIGFTFGPAHIEFRIVGSEIYIIEINPRLAGGMIPILIEKSQSINLINNIIKLYAEETPDFTPQSSLLSKIEFFIPIHSGLVASIVYPKNLAITGAQIGFYKEIGDMITIQGNFNDRLGYVIAQAANIEECKRIIDEIKDKVTFTIEGFDKVNNYGRSRLGTPLDPRVTGILEKDFISNINPLKFLSDINKAHILMLQECNIISRLCTYKLLHAVEKLEIEDFIEINKATQLELGFYLAYEQTLADKIGIDIAGMLHTARSRNDINATISKLKLREIFLSCAKASWELRSTLLQMAVNFIDCTMPVYSQYQAAMPSTYAYYLLATEQGLADQWGFLNQIADKIDISPLGAVSGAGTIFPINPNITAELLGFRSTIHNALTAVASRDLELIMLASGAITGTHLSRIAHDYQLWSTQEFGFFDIPNNLCGISSAMPQKKNPYLLEKIKGKSIRISSELFFSMSVIQKTPFSNSLEVGTEAFLGFEKAFNELIKAIKLLILIIENAKPVQDNMNRSNINGLTVATIIAESLVKEHNISCREAHHIVGKTISDNQNPLNAILSLGKISQDSTKWHLPLEYGSGSGKSSTQAMLINSIKRLNEDSGLVRTKEAKWQLTSQLLNKKVQQFLATYL